MKCTSGEWGGGGGEGKLSRFLKMVGGVVFRSFSYNN